MDDYGESIDAGGNRDFFKMIKERRKNIMLKKTGTKTKHAVKLPKYKVEEKDPTYKLRRGKVMEAHSDLHANKDGKRTITTKMKIWQDLTPKDKASLKRSIMLAIDHKFKGGSISDFPKDIQSTVKAIVEHFGGRGIVDTGVFDTNDFKNMGSTLAPQLSRNIENGIGGFTKNVMNLKSMADKLKGRKGKGFSENFFKPKGHRQLIYFSDSSSDEDEPHLPVKRGRGRPRCS